MKKTDTTKYYEKKYAEAKKKLHTCSPTEYKALNDLLNYYNKVT